MLKRCAHCKIEKPTTEFRRNSSRKDGLCHYCKPCQSADIKAYNTRNPDKLHAYRVAYYIANRDSINKKNKARHEAQAPEQRRDRELKYNYNVPPGTYDALLEAQGGKCAICGTTEPRRGNGRDGRRRTLWFALDHCHITGAIRGLLCHPCNTGIGLLQHDPKILRRAIDYVS